MIVIFLLILREALKLLFTMPEVKPSCDDMDSWLCGWVVIAGFAVTTTALLGAGAVTAISLSN